MFGSLRRENQEGGSCTHGWEVSGGVSTSPKEHFGGVHIWSILVSLNEMGRGLGDLHNEHFERKSCLYRLKELRV